MVGLVLLVVALHVASLGIDDFRARATRCGSSGSERASASSSPRWPAHSRSPTEFRTGTIRPTLLVTPRRSRVVAAKVVASMLAGAGAVLVAEALNAGGEAAGLALRGIQIRLGAGDYVQLLAGGASPARCSRRSGWESAR